MQEESGWQKFKTQFKKHWLTIWFVLGFFTDALLLNRIDDVMDNLILLAYVLLATFSLILFYVGVAQKLGGWFSKKLIRYMPGVMQYSFGGLLSGMLIFYGRSGDWITSAPFLLLILSVILGNEMVHKRSDRLVYHIALYFIGLFSYSVLVLPIVFGAMGDLMFFLSGLTALLWVTIVVQILYRVVPNFMRVNTRRIVLLVGVIYMSLNSLYYTGVLPPIPLSLTEHAIVHSVTKPDANTYRIVTEDQAWWRELPFMEESLHPVNAELSCFARVYAPAKLSTEIYHRWEYKGPDGKWVERARIKYPIAGSNASGYRGYTTVGNVTSGKWRCSVETERGQVLGRSTAYVVIGGEGTPVTKVE
ncbi:MAG: DUF2914 domain-containing protein [Candidatus Pacebacteria bacterium]|nr:DUF2914 domain-containing protein [Candidatus Paceibacterota bacterium]MBP9842815.1 DUF2914 domain-containing protein [Candidatus Paceibacterota bacterium]